VKVCEGYGTMEQGTWQSGWLASICESWSVRSSKF